MNIGIGSGSAGRRKSLDAEVNLVPFIDLLSMCICFLLMTAVWIEVGAVQIKQSRGTEAAAVRSEQMEMTVKFASVDSLEMTVKKAGKVVGREILRGATIAELLTKLDVSLDKFTPESIASAMVSPKTGVAYGDLVSVIDMLRRHRIINLGVVPTEGG